MKINLEFYGLTVFQFIKRQCPLLKINRLELIFKNIL